MNLAFSTSWNSARHIRGDTLLQEIFDLGFNRIELGHGIRLSLWDGIAQFVHDHPGSISSLHNYCPLPMEVTDAAPDVYQCTSHSTHERARALRYTLQTIDCAKSVGATTVILHLGSVPMPPYTERLLRRIHAGKLLDRRFVSIKIKAIQQREKATQIDLALDWLHPVVEHAAKVGIDLAVENRIGIETIPSETEFDRLFARYPEIGYWHDIGHAQVRDNLSFIDHTEWLRRMSTRLRGCHVHDVQFPDVDHQAPFTGMVDFRSLILSIPPGIPMVWELSPRVEKDSIRAGLLKWREMESKALQS
ncbi:MAG: sugar phosphate isomerase/epimerase [Verrucomicrobia bacterium]|nr:sugar phosphate isomerase/epimerase [Verrucomicrobiota bacterium]